MQYIYLSRNNNISDNNSNDHFAGFHLGKCQWPEMKGLNLGKVIKNPRLFVLNQGLQSDQEYAEKYLIRALPNKWNINFILQWY